MKRKLVIHLFRIGLKGMLVVFLLGLYAEVLAGSVDAAAIQHDLWVVKRYADGTEVPIPGSRLRYRGWDVGDPGSYDQNGIVVTNGSGYATSGYGGCQHIHTVGGLETPGGLEPGGTWYTESAASNFTFKDQSHKVLRNYGSWENYCNPVWDPNNPGQWTSGWPEYEYTAGQKDVCSGMKNNYGILIETTWYYDMPYEISGKITDPSGTGLAGFEVGVKNAVGNNDPNVDPTNWSRVWTDAAGNWSVPGFIPMGEDYAVRILTVPAGFQTPTTSRWDSLGAANGTPIGWTWIQAAGRDTTVGELSYESQRASVNDCAGPAGAGGASGRCNFIAQPDTQAPQGLIVLGPQVIGLNPDQTVNETSTGATATFNIAATDTDGNLNWMALYRSPVGVANDWVQLGSNIDCTGTPTNCSASIDWDLTAATGTNDGAGDYYVAMVIFDDDGNQCSGNVLPDTCNPNDPFGPACTDLWGNPLSPSTWYSCGVGNSDVVTVRVIEPPLMGTPVLDEVALEADLVWGLIGVGVDNYLMEVTNTATASTNNYAFADGLTQTTVNYIPGDPYAWRMRTVFGGVHSGYRNGPSFTGSQLLVEPTVVPYTPTP